MRKKKKNKKKKKKRTGIGKGRGSRRLGNKTPKKKVLYGIDGGKKEWGGLSNWVLLCGQGGLERSFFSIYHKIRGFNSRFFVPTTKGNTFIHSSTKSRTP